MSSAKPHVHESVTERPLDPSADLHPATLVHACEHRALSEALTRKVDASLASGAAFPHTTFVGCPGSGKRGLALALAADLGAPVIEARLAGPEDLRRLHHQLRSATAGTVVLFDCGAVRNQFMTFAAQRLRQGRRIWDPAHWTWHGEPPEPWMAQKLRERCYPALVVVATEEDRISFFDLFDEFSNCGRQEVGTQRVFVSRSQATDRAQLARALRRRRLPIEDAAIDIMATQCFARSLSLIDMVNALTEWCHAHPGSTMDEEAATTVAGDLVAFMAPPTNPKGMLHGSIDRSVDHSIDMCGEVKAGRKAVGSASTEERRELLKFAAVVAGMLFVVVSLASVTGLSIHSAIWGTDPSPPPVELVASP